MKMDEKEKTLNEEINNPAWQALRRVREAEEKARQMVEEARQKSFPEIIKRAGEEAEEIKRKILTESRNQAESIRRDIIQKAESQALAIKNQTETEKQALLNQVETNFDEAVRKTVEKLKELLNSREG